MKKFFRVSLFIILTALLFGLIGCSGSDDISAPIGTEYPEHLGNGYYITPSYTDHIADYYGDYYEDAILDIDYQANGGEEALLGADYQINDTEEGYILEIRDPTFAIQMQEIQQNRNAFIGRTIRYEGVFLSSSWEGETFYFIARLLGGCCGVYGFEAYLNDFAPFDDETWVEVTGILEKFYLDSDHYVLRLNVISLLER